MRQLAMRRLCLAAPALVFGLIACEPRESIPDEPIPYNQDVMPGEALSPEEAIARMSVPDGFQVELVAAEPDIVNPIAMTFDEQGRVWITESLEYPRFAAGTGRDRIKVLEDTDGDGQADKVTIFADTLNIPSGIAVGYGGVWVANSPDILFMQDTDGDGRADRSEVVVTGFGRDDTHELPNSLTWGPDGYLYGLNGVFNRSVVTSGGKTYDFTAAVFRINPRTHEFELFAEGTSNPWGLAFDPEGNAFIVACVIEHLWHVAESGYYRRQAGAYPPHTWILEAVNDHQHLKAAYCGLTYHDSDAYPERWRDRLFMGNIHGASLNVDILQARGASYTSTGDVDFFQANDAWFMPVSQKTGPDGSLYILDWYDRYHCFQDAMRDSAGVDRLNGRLYRIRYGDTPRAPAYDLRTATDDALIDSLSSGNIYFRETAQRLLTERDRPEARTRLEALVLDTDRPRKTRMHALWALAGTGHLDPDFHLALLDHDDPGYRAWGVRAAGNYGDVAPAVRDRVAALAGDAAPEVQLQVATAAAKIDGLDPVPLLTTVLAAGTDPLVAPIVWQNLHPRLDAEGDRFLAALNGLDLNASDGLAEVISRATDRLLSTPEPRAATLIALFDLLLDSDRPADAGRAFAALAERVQTGQIDPPARQTLQTALLPVVRRALDTNNRPALQMDAAFLAATWGDEAAWPDVRAVLRNADLPDARRIQAVQALIAAGDPTLLNAVQPLLAADAPASDSLQRAVLGALGRLDDAQVAGVVMDIYPALDPGLQPVALDLLTQRAAWRSALVDAVEDGRLPARAFTPDQIRSLLADADSAFAGRVSAALGAVRPEPDADRQQVIAEVRDLMATREGDPEAGAQVFDRICAQCHMIYGRGQSIGPDLTGSGRGTVSQLLSNVFDPNLVIGAGYQLGTVTTRDGRTLSGMVTEETDARILLRMLGGKVETLARDAVEELVVSPVSFMPEGLEHAMSEQEIVDLMAFLTLDGPPGDPETSRIPDVP